MSIKESALTAIQTIADTDFIRAVTSLGASRKVLASDVGKYVLEDYAETELGGEQQSVKDAVDNMATELGTLDTKADINGSYPALTAGDAEQVLSTDFIDDSVPYLFRQTAGGAKVGNRLYETIVGGTVAWNQLIKDPTLATQAACAYATFSVSNGVGTATANGGANSYITIVASPLPPKDHVIFMSLDVMLDSNNSGNYDSTVIVTSWSGGYKGVANAAKGTWKTMSTVVKPTANPNTCAFYVFDTVTTTAGDKAYVKNPIYVDLTKLFGSTIADYIYSLEQANAGAGVAFFRSLFPKPYCAYNAGELISVKTSSHDTVGFNQWDEEWESGQINITTGENTVAPANIRSKNYIPIIPNKTYFVYKSSTAWGFVKLYYDANKNYISYASNWNAETFTTPSNAYFMRFYCGSEYGTTYNNDICINISDASKNGTYEPYTKNEYPLDADLELRGIPKLDANNKLYYDGDTYKHDGSVTRKYAIKDMGDVPWTYNGTRFAGSISDITLKNTRLKGICTAFPVFNGGVGDAPDNSLIFGGENDTYVYVKTSLYTDVQTFETAMTGQKIVYELATPTTEIADAFTSPQIPYTGGTEQYVDERDVAIPVGHNSQYSIDLRSRLEALPDDLSMIAPVEKGYTATQNYSVGAYLIVGNNFYKVTSAIANGGAITPGTNVTATTVATELIALR